MKRVLDAQVADVARAVARGLKPRQWAAAFRRKWERAMRKAKGQMVLDMAVDGYSLGEAELGLTKAKDMFWLIHLLGKAVRVSTTDEALKQTRLRADVEKYVNETSKLETAESAKRLGRYHEIALAADMTHEDMAKLIKSKGLALSKTRAMLMARTTTIWAYNNGAMQAYGDAGVGAVEWIATIDAATDPVCAATDGEQRKIGQTFSSGVTHPPVHPNCRCALAPVVDVSRVAT